MFATRLIVGPCLCVYTILLARNDRRQRNTDYWLLKCEFSLELNIFGSTNQVNHKPLNCDDQFFLQFSHILCTNC